MYTIPCRVRGFSLSLHLLHFFTQSQFQKGRLSGMTVRATPRSSDLVSEPQHMNGNILKLQNSASETSNGCYTHLLR